jgi:hypothetical protein
MIISSRSDKKMGKWLRKDSVRRDASFAASVTSEDVQEN